MTDEFIPLSTPWLGGKEKEYLSECIDTGWVAAGPFIRRFEEHVSGFLGAADCVAVSSGTAALHVALKLMGVGLGDEVICPTLTFVATTNAIVHTGARPVFVDSQLETWGMDASSLRGFLEDECERESGPSLVDKVTRRPVKAIVAVHLFGHPVDMDQVLEVAQEYGLPVIEDATESLGSLYKGKPTGTLGRIGCLSFNGNKTVTSGGGGMLVSDDSDLLRRARYLINQAHDDSLEFHHSEVGYNYRLSNLHAAVGLAQVERLDEFISARRSIAEQYADAFSEVPGITFFGEQPWAASNYWLSTVMLDPELFAIPAEEVMARMRECKIEVRRPFVPNHQLPPYKGDRAFGELPVSVSLYQQGLNLPSSAWMKPEQVGRAARQLISLGEKA